MRRRKGTTQPEAVGLIDSPRQQMSFTLLYARRLARWLQNNDLYLVYAILGVLVYIFIVGVAAHYMEQHLLNIAHDKSVGGGVCLSLFANTTHPNNNNNNHNNNSNNNGGVRRQGNNAVPFVEATDFLDDTLQRSARLLHHVNVTTTKQQVNAFDRTTSDSTMASFTSLLWENRALRVWYALALRSTRKPFAYLGTKKDTAHKKLLLLQKHLAAVDTNLDELVAYLNASEAEAATLSCAQKKRKENALHDEDDRERMAECAAAHETRRMWCAVLKLLAQDETTSDTAKSSCATRMAALGVTQSVVKECPSYTQPVAEAFTNSTDTIGTWAHEALQAERASLLCDDTLQTKAKAGILAEKLTQHANQQQQLHLLPSRVQQVTRAQWPQSGVFAVSENEWQSYALLLRGLELESSSGTSAMSLYVAYDKAVAHILIYLLRSSVIPSLRHKNNNNATKVVNDVGDAKTNATLTQTSKGYNRRPVTFATYRAGFESSIPVMHFSSCALPGLLARGLRLGAHRYSGRSTATTNRFAEDEILRVTEELAASCQAIYYYDSLPQHGPIYMTVPHNTNSSEVPFALPHKTTSSCDALTVLLKSYYELYASTHDAMYIRWSLRLLQNTQRTSCGVQSLSELRRPAVWRNYLLQLRTLTMLLVRSKCVEWASQKYAACAELDGRHGTSRSDTLWGLL